MSEEMNRTDNMMSQLKSAFLDHLSFSGYAKQTIKTHRIAIQNLEDYCQFKKIDTIESLKTSHLVDFITTLSKGNQASTVHMKVLQLKRFFAFLSVKGFISHDPTVALDIPKAGKTLPKAIPTIDEFDHLIKATDSHTLTGFMYRTIIELLYGSGMRIEEVIHLKGDDINLNEGKVHLKQSKTLKERVVPLPERVLNMLSLYLSKVRPELVSIENVASDLVFISTNGTMIAEKKINEKIKSYCESAGIDKHLTSHSFRYAFATHLFEKKCDIRYISELLGHKFLSTTAKYILVSKKELVDVLKQYHPREKSKVIDYPDNFFEKKFSDFQKTLGD